MKIMISGFTSDSVFRTFEVLHTDSILMSNIQGHFELWHRDYPEQSSCRVLNVDIYADMDTVHIDVARGNIDRAYNYFG